MKDFKWALVDSSVNRIVVWGTGKWGDRFRNEADLYYFSEGKLFFTNSSEKNDRSFPHFVNYNELSSFPDKEHTLVVIAIKDIFAIKEIAKIVTAMGFTCVLKYIPTRADYDILSNVSIFMLHRVFDWEKGRLFSNENMKLKPESLDCFLTFLESQNQDFVSLSDLPTYLKTGKGNGIVFTMDDGYKDNLLEALPIFKKHNVPFTIFVTTDFPEKKAILWWYVLEDLILNHDFLTLGNGVMYPCNTFDEKEKAFLNIRSEILKLDQINLEKELNDLFAGYDVDWFSKNDDLCLSWDDIEKLKEEPLVTIGAHTGHHYNLKQLPSKKAVEDEVNSGINLLKGKAGINPKVFAYPFGSPNEVSGREVSVLRNIPELECACLAYGGTIVQSRYCDTLKKIFPRIMLTEDYIYKSLADGIER